MLRSCLWVMLVMVAAMAKDVAWTRGILTFTTRVSSHCWQMMSSLEYIRSHLVTSDHTPDEDTRLECRNVES